MEGGSRAGEKRGGSTVRSCALDEDLRQKSASKLFEMQGGAYPIVCCTAVWYFRFSHFGRRPTDVPWLIRFILGTIGVVLFRVVRILVKLKRSCVCDIDVGSHSCGVPCDEVGAIKMHVTADT